MSALRALQQLKLAAPRLRLAAVPLARLPLLAAATPVAARAFSASTSSRTAGPGPSTAQLAARLQEELKYEITAAEEAGTDGVPAFLADFRESGIWTIEDAQGNDEVFLTRTFGDENIRVMFSIADLQASEEDFEEEPEAEAPPTEMRVSLSITKTSSPAGLNVDLYCAEGALEPAMVSFFASGALARDLTIDADFKRRTLYVGPHFETLDSSLQESFKRFLVERDINAALARFIPEYAHWKEQREYVQWLEGVSKFVAA
ncbi:mitochondrial glycoprotein [Mycena rosella]|uniref:Mitochondrial glycoprotein n=1 Tax=Mycena rosella TaxID=1033263 RepID=A0AAD7DW49_MYCRO|nr:mitochondrial glycoprotein [Mycena rosella]